MMKFSTPEETQIEIEPLANDYDVDKDFIQIQSVGDPAFGEITLNTNTIIYTPAPYFNGVDYIPYSIIDSSVTTTKRVSGGPIQSSSAIITVTVTPINNPPNAVNDGIIAIEDTPIDFCPLDNDFDIDNDVLSIVTISTPSNGKIAFTPPCLVTYTPNTNFNGVDKLTYSITDGTVSMSAAITISVSVIPDTPIAVTDYVTLPENSVITIDPLANDVDPDGNAVLAITNIAAGPFHGKIAYTSTTIEYTPSKDYNGVDFITYTVSSFSGSSDGTISITVTPVNSDPTLLNDNVSTNEDTPVDINVVSNDYDVDGDNLIVTGVSKGKLGTATFTSNSVTYTPFPNTFGKDVISYAVTDGTVTLSALISITIFFN